MPQGTSAWVPLANITLGSALASITFSNIPATYKDLVIIADGQSVSLNNTISFVFNGDVGTTTYWLSNIAWNGSATANNTNAGRIDASASSSTLIPATRDCVIMSLFDYTATDKFKSVMVRSNVYTPGSGGLELVSGRWSSTAVVNSIKVQTASTGGFNMIAGTNVSLYGIAG